MERIKNPLFLNYVAPIGKRYSFVNNKYALGKVFKYVELLVPGTSDDDILSLTALSKSFSAEARRHNMSLKTFGVLDPIKIIIATTFAALAMGEVYRDLGASVHYEYGNKTAGAVLCKAVGCDGAVNTTNYANLCKLYNSIVAKFNSMYLPQTELTNRWIDHRTHVYKDDDGDRYQYYIYRMAGIYYLDVDPNSNTVGQLVFDKSWGTMTDTQAKLNRINQILESYLGDDDVNGFINEALHAGMTTTRLLPIKGEDDSYELVRLEEAFDLDDVQSLENSRIVPVITSIAPGGASAAGIYCNLNIWEDTVNNTLQIGQLYNGTYLRSGIHAINPTYAITYLWGSPNGAYGDSFETKVSDLPVFTHCKYKSEEGLHSLLKYVNAISRHLTLTVGTVEFMINGELRSVVFSNTANVGFHSIDVFGPSILVGCQAYGWDVDTNTGTQVVVTYQQPYCWNIVDSYQALHTFSTFFTGFKGKPYVFLCTSHFAMYQLASIHDFDYIVYVSDTSLSSFFGTFAWNNLQLLIASTSFTKRNKPQKKDEETSDKK